jgi:16S rRNA (adenine1518-N6/adenine1519-N6)-dimethyltransferase
MPVVPDKSKGQHFLVDDQVVADLVTAGQVDAGDYVVEIGPGPGVVTEGLLAAGATVVAVELDRRFESGLLVLARRYPSKLQVVWGDAVTLGPVGIVDRIKDSEFRVGIDSNQSVPYRVVSSLPYNISSSFFRTFLWNDPAPVRLAVLVQAEVAERVCAEPGHTSLLTLAVQLRGHPKIIRYVEPDSFKPQPKVRSAIVVVDVEPGKIQPSDALWRVARIGFSSRRKQLKNNLAAGLGVSVAKASDWLESIGASVQARAQELTMEQWGSLVQTVRTSELQNVS